jgi:hypothetical protein
VYPWRVVVSFTEGGIFLFSLFVYWTAGNDGIGDEGAIGIAKGLETNTSLGILYLRGVFRAYLFVYSFLRILPLLSPVTICCLELCNSHFCD